MLGFYYIAGIIWVQMFSQISLGGIVVKDFLSNLNVEIIE